MHPPRAASSPARVFVLLTPRVALLAALLALASGCGSSEPVALSGSAAFVATAAGPRIRVQLRTAPKARVEVRVKADACVEMAQATADAQGAVDVEAPTCPVIAPTQDVEVYASVPGAMPWQNSRTGTTRLVAQRALSFEPGLERGFQCAALFGTCGLYLDARDGRLVLHVQRGERGGRPILTRLRFQGATHALDQPTAGAVELPVDAERAIAAANLTDLLLGRGAPPAGLEVTAESEFGSAAVTLPVTAGALAGVVLQQLKGVARGPLLPATPPAGSGAVFVSDSHVRVWGAPRTLADVREVVVAQYAERQRSCGAYRGAATGRLDTSIHVSAVDETLVVFERHTGRRLAEESFRADLPRCLRVYRQQNRASVPRETIDAWLDARYPSGS